MPPARGRTTTKAKALPFDRRLVLNQYLLGLFGVTSFEELASDLKDPDYEQVDAEGATQLHRVLAARFPNLPNLSPPGPSPDDLLRYDANIVRHTRCINLARKEDIRWKYFQYLALLFTEIYLDRYFTDAELLRTQLNTHLAAFNAGVGNDDQVDPYELADLRKLALWMATGSGKTLLMQVNILQFLHYLEASGRRGEINRILLVTPNEGLSAQHLREFARSGLHAYRFARNRRLECDYVEVIEITKLGDEEGEQTVAVESFEGNNLVFVDEGHRGVAGEQWKERRDRLCADGFAFEYSATFGQAVKATGRKKSALAQEYARAILFDYSYKYFYGDGYGKDYQILNFADGDGDTEHLYLTAALLAFYQQQQLFDARRGDPAFAAYGLDRPLWVFVGGSVSKSLALNKDEQTDVVRILTFLARFVRGRAESVAALTRLLSGNTGLTAGGRDIFANKFPTLARYHGQEETLFDDILEGVFNAHGSAPLHVEELKGADGELALRIGPNDPFGVVNVGNARELAKLCATKANDSLVVTEHAFSGSLFGALDAPASTVNLLIGSRKFSEGWNSYRVSSLGLMHLGKGEGAQIIQLFGRGVRLRGYQGSLKRSGAIADTRHPEQLRLLETLNVYGVQADYMAQFKEYLEEEGCHRMTASRRSSSRSSRRCRRAS